MFSGHSPVPSTKSGSSLSDDAISGGVSAAKMLADQAKRFLDVGDFQGLRALRRQQFGGLVMMADGDNDDDDGDGDNDGDGDDDSGDSGDGDGGDGDNDDSSGDDDDDDTKAELERIKKRMQAADQRAAKAEAALKKIEDGKKDDLTKATDRVTELETEVKEKDTTISGLRLQVGFLSTNKHTWHKPGAALKLAQSEGYLADVIGDDGEVDNKKMGSALDKLAKEHAYLVKTGDGGSGASGGGAGGRSGNGKDDKATQEQDRRRAPALNRRR